MLFSKLQAKPSYDFVPHTSGCFSYQADADLNTMAKYQQVSFENGIWSKTDASTYLPLLIEDDKRALKNLTQLYGKKTTEELSEVIYKRYPFYAINSVEAEKMLSGEELDKVKGIKNALVGKVLFTIGYEGVSLESYLNKLLKYGIRVLVDVRKNPQSMKYGFNKKQLDSACNDIGISYMHFPELGIESDKRQELNSQNDYNILFKEYKKKVLPCTVDIQDVVVKLIAEHGRVALTCFEANICQCHRKPLAESISKLPDFSYELKHI